MPREHIFLNKKGAKMAEGDGQTFETRYSQCELKLGRAVSKDFFIIGVDHSI